MEARDEPNLEVTDPQGRTLWRDLDHLLLVHPAGSRKHAGRHRTHDLRPGQPCDEGRVEEVVEMTMPEEHPVDTRGENSADGGFIGLERSHELSEIPSGEVRIHEQRRSARLHDV